MSTIVVTKDPGGTLVVTVGQGPPGYSAGGVDVAIADGGTGASDALGARTNLGLGSVDNTSDASKPVSTAQAAATETHRTTAVHVAPQPPIIGATAAQAVAGNDARLSDARTPTGGAGGVLSGLFPAPGFAVDMATQAELDAEATARATGDAGRQPLDPDLSAIAALDSAQAGVVASDGAGWLRKTYTAVKTSLGLVKADVGLASVDDTTDLAKPVSTAQAAALALKADTAVTVVFDTPGAAVWTKPAGAKAHYVRLYPGGSGGGSGRKGAAGTVRCGGGGGAGPAYSVAWFQVSELGATEALVVGAGGPGGAAVAVNDTNGKDGTSGGFSCFGGTARASAKLSSLVGTSAAGKGGTATGGAGSTSSYGTSFNGVKGAPASATGTAGTFIDSSGFHAGGASGGGITSADAQSSGGAGAVSYAMAATRAAAGAAPGGAGGDGAAGTLTIPGSPGGGGASSTVGNAGRGGHGGAPGGSGGGGGAAVNAVGNSGAGGNGANGRVVVVSFF